MTFTNGKYCPEVPYGTEESFYSLRQLASTGSNYVSIVVTWYQDTLNSTTLFPLYSPIKSHYYTYITETEDQLIDIIQKAQQIGLKVMLKPQIDLIKDDDHWRGDIGKYFTQEQWDEWFASYTEVVLKYARMAERLGVAEYSVGCELIATSPQEANWRKLIDKVRQVYKGIVIYSSNWGYLDAQGGEETHKKWWDAVDIMGIDSYYEIAKNITNPTLDDLVKGWQPVVQRFRNLTQTFNRPIMMSEIGFCSGECKRGEKVALNNFYQQALHYEAAFQAFSNLDFPFLGFFWWTWNSDPASGGMKDTCITPQSKPSELVVRYNYGGLEILPPWKGEPKCQCTV